MTIKDLSALTGYSVGTISRVLNDQPNVSQKARDTILQAVADSGFQLNTNAKQLKQQHGNSILMVVKGIRNELFSAMVEIIQGHFSSLKHPLIVDYLDEDQNEVARALQLCAEKKPLGILFLGGNHRNFQSHFSRIDVPCVLVTNNAGAWRFDNLSSVSTDDFSASQAAMAALIQLGHKNIVMIGGKYDGSDTSRLRYQGCLSSLMQHNIDFDPLQDYEAVRFSYRDGYDATCRLLQKGKKFTAL